MLAGRNMGSNERIYGGDEAIRDFVRDDKVMAKCIDFIQNILEKEHYKGKIFSINKEIALHLDKYEHTKNKGKSNTQTNNTVDFVVCLKQKWLLLVEAKLDVDNVENIKKDIFDKIQYSRDILISKNAKIEKIVVILLKDKYFEQKKNKLMRLLIPKNGNNIKPYKVEDFYNTFFKKIQ